MIFKKHHHGKRMLYVARQSLTMAPQQWFKLHTYIASCVWVNLYITK